MKSMTLHNPTGKATVGQAAPKSRKQKGFRKAAAWWEWRGERFPRTRFPAGSTTKAGESIDLHTGEVTRRDKSNPVVTWVTNPRKRRTGMATRRKQSPAQRRAALANLKKAHAARRKKSGGSKRKTTKRRTPARRTTARRAAPKRKTTRRSAPRRTLAIVKKGKRTVTASVAARRVKKYKRGPVSVGRQGTADYYINPRAKGMFGRALKMVGFGAMAGGVAAVAGWLLTKIEDRIMPAAIQDKPLAKAGVELAVLGAAAPLVMKVKSKWVRFGFLVGLPIVIGARAVANHVLPKAGITAEAERNGAEGLMGLAVSTSGSAMTRARRSLAGGGAAPPSLAGGRTAGLAVTARPRHALAGLDGYGAVA